MRIQKQKGITLIVLVVTIIILLVLASVSISMITGENGIITKAKEAKEKVKLSKYEEEINLAIFDTVMSKKAQDNRTFCIRLKEMLKNQKDWINRIETNNEDSITEISYMIITTIEGYEITVEIDNMKETVKIIKVKNEVSEKLILKYDPNGGSGEEQIQYIRENFTITLNKNEFVKPYYTFIGWGTSKTESETVYSEGANYKVTENTILYAQWSQQVANIEFDSNNGFGNMETQQVGLGTRTTIKRNEYTKDGYMFSEWNTKKDGTGTSYKNGDEITLTSTETIKFYAIWSRTITITYNANGGSSTPSAQTKTIYNDTTSETFTVASPISRDYCYTFLGWSTLSTATTPTYIANNNYSFSEDTTLYAIWGNYKEFTAMQLGAINGAYRNDTTIVLPKNSNALSHGPYYRVLKGTYTVYINGSGFLSDMGVRSYQHSNPRIDFDIENIKYTSSQITFNLTINEDLLGSGLEVLIFSSPTNDVIVEGMKWVKN